MGVLVAISIPIFTSQLEKAREATDAANIRSAYAELSAAALTGDGTAPTSGSSDIVYNKPTGTAGSYVYTATITLHQKQADWQDASIKSGNIGGLATGSPTAGGHATLTINEDGTTGTIAYN